MSNRLKMLIVVLFSACGSARATIKAVIFDVDGVIVDTERLKMRAWQRALTPAGVTMTEAQYQRVVGLSNADILADVSRRAGRNLPATLIDQKEEAYRALQRGGVPVIGRARTLILGLAREKLRLGVKIAAASSGYRREIEANLRAAGVAAAFDVIVSGAEDLADVHDPQGTNKPKPYVYQKAVRKLGLAPIEALAYEDSAAGVRAAVAAGLRVFAVPNDFTRDQNFAGARGVLRQLPSIEEWTKTYSAELRTH